MYASLTTGMWALVCASGLTLGVAAGQTGADRAAKSPRGPNDEIGSLNMMTEGSRFDILKQIAAGKVYDLSVELYVGIPGCCAHFGDPTYQIWMTHSCSACLG